MKRVVANLTPLVTCPAFTLWHLFGAAMCIPALVYAGTSADPAVGGYVATFILPAWSAFVLTSLQKDILHKPLSFLLPEHGDVLRRTSFLVGLTVSLVASLPVLTFPGLGGPSLLCAVWSAFCFGFIVYLLIVGVQMLLDAAASLVVLYMVAASGLLVFPGSRVLVQEVAIFAPVWNTIALAALSVFVWRRLGSVELLRRTCGRRFLSLQMIWRRSADEEYRRSGRRMSLSNGTYTARVWLLRRFFDRIGRRPALSWRRHLAAAQYELAGYLLPLSRWTAPVTALLALVILVFAGYVPSEESGAPMANFLNFGICIVAMHMGIPTSGTMLLPAGRRERFYSALALAAWGGLVVLAASLLLFLLHQGMGSLAPPISWRGEIHDFQPAELSPALVPLVLLPLNMILRIVCKKWLLVPQILLVLVAVVFLREGSVTVRGVSPVTAAALLSVSWALLVGVLFSHSFRRDLVPA